MRWPTLPAGAVCLRFANPLLAMARSMAVGREREPGHLGRRRRRSAAHGGPAAREPQSIGASCARDPHAPRTHSTGPGSIGLDRALVAVAARWPRTVGYFAVTDEVTLRVDGTTHTVRTFGDDVADVLAGAGHPPARHDQRAALARTRRSATAPGSRCATAARSRSASTAPSTPTGPPPPRCATALTDLGSALRRRRALHEPERGRSTAPGWRCGSPRRSSWW